MSQIFKKCPICGNTLTIYEKNKNTQCKKCMAEFDTESILDADERTFLKSFSDDKLENTLRYNALIIQANENIEKGLFEKAEQNFKQAIELCENRYEAYYGIARAKTQDFKILPESQDYLEYAKIAISIADDDIDSQINANLAKINVFKNKKTQD